MSTGARLAEKLVRDGQPAIAYHQLGGAAPGVLFLGGFMSDMTGAKATRLEAFCRDAGRQYTRFDYRGHGQSAGRFEAGTISLWRDDALAVLDRVTEGPQILVGSSMGGWLMLLVALARPERVRGLVGIAAAPDFVARMVAGFDAGQRRDLAERGMTSRPSPYSPTPYPITRALIEDGRCHLLLDRPIELAIPVRLLHGLADDSVPWRVSLALAERLASADVRVSLVKGGDHRLSNAADLDLLTATVAEICALVSAGRPRCGG
ncbi:MAG: alpha/beta hydrolase [Alphaproteobacteria bacterium]|nr:alpha/beta hydrolase [Alphaproteobacteria bacterium]